MPAMRVFGTDQPISCIIRFNIDNSKWKLVCLAQSTENKLKLSTLNIDLLLKNVKKFLNSKGFYTQHIDIENYCLT